MMAYQFVVASASVEGKRPGPGGYSHESRFVVNETTTKIQLGFC
jgi:hypothetical protein